MARSYAFFYQIRYLCYYFHYFFDFFHIFFQLKLGYILEFAYICLEILFQL